MLSPSVNRGMRSGNPGTNSGMMVPRFRNAERNMEAVAQNAWRVPAEQHGKIQVEAINIGLTVNETYVQDDAVSIESMGLQVVVNETFVQDDAASIESMGIHMVVQESYASTIVDDAVSVESMGVYVIVMETY